MDLRVFTGDRLDLDAYLAEVAELFPRVQSGVLNEAFREANSQWLNDRPTLDFLHWGGCSPGAG